MFEAKDVPAAKQRLLDAATEVFSTRGYSAARVSDIVAEAGLAQGTFYLYFRSKQAVFVELVDRFFDDLLSQTLGRYPADLLDSPQMLRHQVSEIWSFLLNYARRRPKLTALVMRESTALPPEERARITASYAAAAAGLAAYCREAMRRGIMRKVDPDLAGWLVIGLVERAVHYAVFVDPDTDLASVVGDLVTIELSGLLESGEKVSEAKG